MACTSVAAAAAAVAVLLRKGMAAGGGGGGSSSSEGEEGRRAYEEVGVSLEDGTAREHEPEIGLLRLELRRDELVQPARMDLHVRKTTRHPR
jgi:hypothetical protein